MKKYENYKNNLQVLEKQIMKISVMILSSVESLTSLCCSSSLHGN